MWCKLLSWSVLAGCWLTVGCNEGGKPGGFFLFPQSDAEKWTIRCYYSKIPNHDYICKQLADLLKSIDGLNPDLVRVETTTAASSIYYGEYVKVPSRERDHLVFPPKYQKDIDFIQRLTINQSLPFRFAKPELIKKPSDELAPAMADWDVRQAKGTYTLQIGVFYNTPTFQERRKAAEEYVKLLRQDGFDAYYLHQDTRSFVFVGDFEESDTIQTQNGIAFGPRVEQLIARRPEEFRHMLENLHKVKHSGPGGQMSLPPSILVPVPREGRQE